MLAACLIESREGPNVVSDPLGIFHEVGILKNVESHSYLKGPAQCPGQPDHQTVKRPKSQEPGGFVICT